MEILDVFWNALVALAQKSGFCNITLQQGFMIAVSFLLMYLAIVRKFEPLLLLPIAFGMMLTNIPGANMFHPEMFGISPDPAIAANFAENGVNYGEVLHNGGLLDILYLGVKLQIFPPLIFLGIGCMTDFGPLIANPKSLLLGVFVTFLGACAFSLTGIEGVDFSFKEAASIGIIGGADGPTAIFLTSKLAPQLLGSIAVAAYSYMALVPVIQPPIMKLLTTKKERAIVMESLRPVTKREKIIFPVAVTLIVAFIVPDATPLVGMLMLGNLFRESGVVDRLVKTASNELMNIITIMLGTVVGATATAENFLTVKTLIIVALGLIAFCFGTAGGLLLAKLMNKLSGGKINPLIGSAGVSAVPMAARVSQTVGSKENPSNFLLMHAMGPNVAGVIGSAVAAGVLLNIFG